MSEDKKLKEEFCVFFDVLGTKSKFLTSNFEEEEKLVKKYENFIKDIKEILINNGFKENEIKLFSDSIFINFPNTTLKEIYDIFRCLAYIQIMAIEKYNFLLRGGVEYSTIYNEKDIVIGKGLVEAVELEKKANYPIIMLGERAQKEDFKNHYLVDEKYINETLKKLDIKNIQDIKKIDIEQEVDKIKIEKKINGESGATVIRINDRTYINYLGIYHESQNKENFIKMMLSHKNFIIESLKKNKEEFLKNIKNFDSKELKNHFDYIFYNIKKNYILEYIKEIDEQNSQIDSNIFENEYNKNNRRKEELINNLKNIEKYIEKKYFYLKDIENNILKIREKYIYLLYYHNSFLERVYKLYKDIEDVDYNDCFIDIYKEIL